MNDVRKEGFEDFTESPRKTEDHIQQAAQKGIQLGEHLQQEFAERDDYRHHPIVSKNFLQMGGVRLKPEGRRGASTPKEALDTPWKRALVLDECENVYQMGFGTPTGRREYEFASEADRLDANRLKAAEVPLPPLTMSVRESLLESGAIQLENAESSTVGGFTPGNIQRPYQDGDPLETPDFIADVMPQDLGVIIPIDRRDFRVGTFELNDPESIIMKHIPVGTPSPTVKPAEDEIKASVHRHALGVEIGDDLMDSDNPTLMLGLQRFVEEISMRQSYNYAQVIANLITNGVTAPGGTITNPDLEDVLDMQTQLKRGAANTAIGRREGIIKLLVAQASLGGGTGGNAPTMDERARALVGLMRLGNRNSGPVDGYFFRDNKVATNLANTGDVYLYDKSQTAGILDYARGEMDATQFDASTAMHARYFARYQGHYKKDMAEVIAFRLA